MNKTITLSIAAGLIPFAVTAAGVTDSGLNTIIQGDTTAVQTQEAPASLLHIRKAKTEKASAANRRPDTVVMPVNLDQAVKKYDIVLPDPPIKMQADSVYYRTSDGMVRGRGNVDLYQGSDEIHANYLEGNTKTQIYNIPGKSVWLRNGTALEGTDVIFNGRTRGGTMDSMEGFMDEKVYIRGTGGEVYDNTGYLKHGMITTPHAVAETPDYYMMGDDIHIYPGDEFTSENTSLWFKHVRILTYGHYEGRLDDKDKNKTYLFSLLPRPSYTSQNGFGIYGGALFPMSKDQTLNLRFEYQLFTKIGFKPTLQLEKSAGRFGFFTFGYHSEESSLNDNNIWATKFPELAYRAPRIHFGSSGIFMDNDANWGRWAEDGVDTGTHIGYHGEITHNPIPLWKGANLRFYAGYRKDIYSTNDAMRRDPYHGANLHQQINDHLWTDVWYVRNNISGSSPYNFDTIDNPRKDGITVGYVLSPYDTIVFTLAKDVDSKEISDRNITWIRDLHSFAAVITYKQVDKSWEIHVRAKDF